MLYRYAVVALLKLSKMKAFKLLLPNGGMVDQNTLFMFSGVKRKVSNEAELCKVMRGIWRTDTNSKSFQDWADELNNDGNFEGTFTKYDALDNLASAFVLNIGSECIDIYNFYLQHLPFKETV